MNSLPPINHPPILSASKLTHNTFARLDSLFSETPAVLGLAVSGGSDSLALLYLTYHWAQKTNVQLTAATVDHGIRKEAAAEANWVKDICNTLDIPHTTLNWAPDQVATTQATARNARHRLLCDWAATQGIEYLLLGHTQDDQIETFLMRVRAGSTWYGLAGLPRKSPSPIWPEGRALTLIRPLLDVTRCELSDFLAAHSLRWIDDPSNENMKYERIRTRRLVSNMSGDARNKAVSSINRMKLLRETANAELDAWNVRHIKQRIDGSMELDRDAFLALGDERGQRFLALAGMCVSGAKTQARTQSIASALSAIKASFDDAVTFGQCWCVWRQNALRLYRRPTGEKRTPGAPVSETTPVSKDMHTLIWDNRFEITITTPGLAGRITSWEQAHNSGYSLPERPDHLSDERARRSAPLFIDNNDHCHVIGGAPAPNQCAYMQPLAYDRLRSLFFSPC